MLRSTVMLVDDRKKNAQRLARIDAILKELRLRSEELHKLAAQVLEHSRRSAASTRRKVAQARGSQAASRPRRAGK